MIKFYNFCILIPSLLNGSAGTNVKDAPKFAFGFFAYEDATADLKAFKRHHFLTLARDAPFTGWVFGPPYFLGRTLKSFKKQLF